MRARQTLGRGLALAGALLLTAAPAVAATWRISVEDLSRGTPSATGTNGFAVCRLEPAAGPSGGAALHLRDDVAGRVNNVLTYRFAPAAVAQMRGRTLGLSAKVRQAAASSPSDVGFSLGAYGAKGVSRTIGTGTRGATPWQTLQVKVRVPADARQVVVNLNCANGWGGTGEAWFADLVLTDDPADRPKMAVADFRAFDEYAYRLPAATDDTPEAAAFRQGYREQPPQEEDGKARPEIRDGTFWYRGRPHFFVGPWVYNRTEMDWRADGSDKLGIGHIAYREPPGTNVWAAVGFDSLQISAAPARYGALLRGFPVEAFRRLGDPDWKVAEQRLDAYFARFGGAMPMVMDFAFGYRGLYGKDVGRLLDQRKGAWHDFVPLCPETPEGRAYYRDYFLGGTRAAMRRGANVFLYELFNESSYNCMCRANVVAFAKEMKRRYGTVAAANATWDTDFDHFAEVAAQTNLKQYPGVWHDWCGFATARYVALLRAGRDAVRSADRRSRVYFAEQAAGTPPAWRGMDYRRIADALDVLAVEGGFQYGSRSGYAATNMAEAVCATGGSRHFYNLDFYQALVRGKPGKVLVNDEHYCTRFENGERVPSKATDYISSLWMEALHGLSASYFYVWDKRSFDYQDLKGAYENVRKPSYKCSSLLNPHNVRPDDLDAFRRFRAEFEPYADRVLPQPRVKPATVAVFFSKASEIHYDAFPRYDKSESPWHPPKNTVTSDWYLRLLHALYPVQVVFEEDLGRLGPEVAALVFPGAPCADDATVAAASAFAAKGGLVVTGPDAFAYDPYLKPRPEGRRGRFRRAATADDALAALAAAKVRRYAALEPLDGKGALRAADVQVCDRGAFKLVTVFSLEAGDTRHVNLRLRHLDGTGPWRVKDVVTGRVLSARATPATLAEGLALDVPPQERVVLAFDLRVKAFATFQESSLSH